MHSPIPSVTDEQGFLNGTFSPQYHSGTLWKRRGGFAAKLTKFKREALTSLLAGASKYPLKSDRG